MTIAFWCVLVASILPYVAFSFVQGVDRNEPRAHVADLDPRSVRAYGAQLNAFEAFPFFAAAVIIAHIAAGPRPFTDVAAVIYILFRVGHMAAYLARNQPARSAAFGLGHLTAVVIFVSPLWR